MLKLEIRVRAEGGVVEVSIFPHGVTARVSVHALQSSACTLAAASLVSLNHSTERRRAEQGIVERRNANRKGKEAGVERDLFEL